MSAFLRRALGTSAVVFVSAFAWVGAANASVEFTVGPWSPDRAGQNPNGVSSADLDSDGFDDLVILSNQAMNFLVVQMNSGDGEGSMTPMPASGHSVPSMLSGGTVGDVNGDGDPDLLVGSGSSKLVYVYAGNGDGTFQLEPLSSFSVGTAGAVPNLGRFNNDQNPDLAFAGPGQAVTVFTGDGTGHFAQVAGSPFAVGVDIGSIGTADLNSDGFTDVVTAGRSTGVLVSNGDGTLSRVTAGTKQIDTVATDVQSGIIDDGDLNGDGKTDVVITSRWWDRVAVFQGDGSGGLTRSHIFNSPGTHGTTGYLDEFDGDVGDELALWWTSAELYSNRDRTQVYDLTAGGSLQASSQGPWYSSHSHAFPGDFDGDPFLDIAGVEYSRAVRVLRNKSPRISLPGPIEFGTLGVGTAAAPRTLTIGNFGLSPLDVTSVALSGPGSGDYELGSHSCVLGEIPVGGECEIEVGFTPSTYGLREAGVVIESEAAGGPRTVALLGTGRLEPDPVLSLGARNFGSFAVGSASQPYEFQITNNGPGALDVTNISQSGNAADFVSRGETCSVNLVPSGGTCDLSFAFVPLQAGARASTVTIQSNSPGDDLELKLTGTGLANPKGRIAAPNVEFDATAVRAVSAIREVVVASEGTTALNIGDIGLSGADPSHFKLDAKACAQSRVEPGSTCLLKVGFVPASVGAKTARIEIGSDSPDPLTVSLSGTAKLPAKLATPKVKGPKRLKKGKPGTFLVEVRNSGGLPASGVTLAVTGKGIGKKVSIGTIAGGVSRSVKVKLKPAKTGKVKLMFKITSADAGAVTAKANLTVRP